MLDACVYVKANSVDPTLYSQAKRVEPGICATMGFDRILSAEAKRVKSILSTELHILDSGLSAGGSRGAPVFSTEAERLDSIICAAVGLDLFDAKANRVNTILSVESNRADPIIAA